MVEKCLSLWKDIERPTTADDIRMHKKPIVTYNCLKGLNITRDQNGLPQAPDWCPNSFKDSAGGHYCVDSGDNLVTVALDSGIIFCGDGTIPRE